MRSLTEAFEAHIGAGVTTLCRCWRLERDDGVVMGFTDHDRAVTIDALVYSAANGIAASGDVAMAGFGVGGLEISGALTSAGLDAGDLQDGRFDFATVELWLVNWANTNERVLLRKGYLGEVTREDGAFRAEVRGPMQALERVRGRVFTVSCDADLGDVRCGVDLPSLSREATVVAVDGARLRVSGLDGAATGYFSSGVVAVTSGEDDGRRELLVQHAAEGEEAVLTLRSGLVGLAVGDTVRVFPGCDKRFETCAMKFANAMNFQGFPHLPGNDRAFSFARPDQ
ncbi:DUF2163 domain-containing protein [Acuticoccus sp. M5D2P5]|uniref:DUF2163 domain-containing protein n=1 Tax=Acuticoccus kalidii TaxID=2910977 RepID=UPI001F1EDEA7|nr:DUF2163 domain-containing protein [Acuticoccus kalidii]MCF3934453.1 DUF2163 domain-containing protein [Acuticoccus kalidii]